MADAPGTAAPTAASLVGVEIELDIGAIAHGGHCVARHEGRVVFVRHALPGERVVAQVTEGHESSRYLRADAVNVIAASNDRVQPPCPHAGPGLCGGCDFQHVRPVRQRELKGQVIQEQLHRLARLDVPVEVERVPGDQEGLAWRTRVRWSATADGQPGLLRHRSDEVLPIDRCRIAAPGLPDVRDRLAAGSRTATAVVTSTGETAVVDERAPGVEVTEAAAGRRWRVRAGDFWQVHPGAAEVLVTTALAMLDPRPGERCWDLYAGAGLFSGSLADRVGPSGAVLSVEGHRRVSRLAEQNLQDLPQVRVVVERIDRFVRSRIAQGRVDVVLLDPPRAGAGREIVRRIAARQPRCICYVSCDPASVARDVATFAAAGYELAQLRAFDLFPMTSHVECVASLERAVYHLR